MRQVELPFITAELCHKVIADPDILRPLVAAAVEELRQLLPEAWRGLDERELRCIVAATLAHNLKPYGPGGRLCDLQSLLSAPTLDCGKYGPLTYYLSRIILPEADFPQFVFVGWHGGAVGNHQTLFVSLPRLDLALDPTLGLAIQATFNHIASGRAVAIADILAINPMDTPPGLKYSREQFIRALVMGAFKPSDLLYFFDGIDHFLSKYGNRNPTDWPTPGGAAMRRRDIIGASPLEG